MESEEIPTEVTEVLKTANIGYLTTISKKGELYSYPVAFYYSNLRVYCVTPASAAKYKMIKENPTVSLIVDNKQLTINACGAMIQGRARTFSVTRTILSILSLGPKVAGFSKKYPGMLTFYAKGKGLPDERKLYKYRIIQIKPTKILYWIGYSFGRYIAKKDKKGSPSFDVGKDEQDSTGFARLFESADEEATLVPGQVDHDWLAKLDVAASSGELSSDERALIGAFKANEVATRLALTKEEKRLVDRWKSRS